MGIHMNLGQAWGPAELASSEAATRRQQEAGGITFILSSQSRNKEGAPPWTSKEKEFSRKK